MKLANRGGETEFAYDHAITVLDGLESINNGRMPPWSRGRSPILAVTRAEAEATRYGRGNIVS